MSLSKRDFFDQPIRNVGSEAIPPFAIVEVKSPGLVTFAGKEWFTVGKPSKQGKTYFVNGPFPVEADGTGNAATPYKAPGVHALYNPSLTPSTNQELGPVDGQWYLGDGKGFFVIGDPAGSAGSLPGLPAVAPTKRVRVMAAAGAAAREVIYGLLVADVAAATMSASGSGQITPGYSTAAVRPMEWGLSGVSDKLNGGDAMDVVNPIWLSTIKAGTTTDIDLPMIVTGTKETRNVYTAGSPASKEVFVLKSVNYPLTVIKGVTQQTVTGQDFTMTVGEVLFGRDPKVSTIIAKNPDGWTGANGVYALAISRNDGLWQAIDLRCDA